jgi:hypothetical protein
VYGPEIDEQVLGTEILAEALGEAFDREGGTCEAGPRSRCGEKDQEEPCAEHARASLMRGGRPFLYASGSKPGGESKCSHQKECVRNLEGPNQNATRRKVSGHPSRDDQ